MAPGALDSLTKEMVYVAISSSNGCRYCVRSHTAAARKGGMTDTMLGNTQPNQTTVLCVVVHAALTHLVYGWTLLGELLAVVGMCNETNRLVQAYDVPIDPMFLADPPGPASAQGSASSPVDVNTMYHNKTFRVVVSNDPSGEVGDETRFHYQQDGNIVHAT